MDWNDWFVGFQCFHCGEQTDRLATTCPTCQSFLTLSGLATALSDLDTSVLLRDMRDLTPILPCTSLGNGFTHPGGTPLIRSPWLAHTSDYTQVSIKHEGTNPTGHVTDRDMAVACAVAASEGEDTVALASPGRSGIAAAAAAGARSLQCHVFVPSRSQFSAKAMINVHGGEMSVIGGRYRDAALAFRDAEADDAWYSLNPSSSPFRQAGRLTMYLEILADREWRAPDTIVLPAASALDVIPLYEAAKASVAADVTKAIPRFIIAQPAGCSPLVDAYAAGESEVSPWESPDTICGELEIGSQPGMHAVLSIIAKTGGEAIAVPDPAALEAAVQLSQRSGCAPSVAGGVAAAALTAVETVNPHESAVVINPGAGSLDADILRSHLMSQGV